MKDNDLIVQSALARLKSWTDALAAARMVGDEQLVREAERFVAEYTILIGDMQKDEAC